MPTAECLVQSRSASSSIHAARLSPLPLLTAQAWQQYHAQTSHAQQQQQQQHAAAWQQYCSEHAQSMGGGLFTAGRAKPAPTASTCASLEQLISAQGMTDRDETQVTQHARLVSPSGEESESRASLLQSLPDIITDDKIISLIANGTSQQYHDEYIALPKEKRLELLERLLKADARSAKTYDGYTDGAPSTVGFTSPYAAALCCALPCRAALCSAVCCVRCAVRMPCCAQCHADDDAGGRVSERDSG